MKLWRYRRPSTNNILGITRLKKRVFRRTGITAMRRPGRLPGNAIRRLKRRAGYEGPWGRMYRHGLPTPGGCLWLVAVGALALAGAVAAVAG